MGVVRFALGVIVGAVAAIAWYTRGPDRVVIPADVVVDGSMLNNATRNLAHLLGEELGKLDRRLA